MFKSIFSCTLALALMTGCATTSDGQRTQTEGTAAGAVIGGVLGAVIGGRRGAAAGAILGAGAGFAAGTQVAKRKQAYATTEEFLDHEIARVEEFNLLARDYNGRLARDIEILDAETMALRERYTAGEARRKDLRSKRRELNSQLARNSELEQELVQEHAIQVAILEEESRRLPDDDPQLADLKREVDALLENIEVLRRSTAQLAQLNERLSA